MSATPELQATMDELDRRSAHLIDTDAELLKSLKASRIRSELSVETVAERMSVSPETVEEFEKYYANPTMSLIRRYAMAVNLELTHTAVELPIITDEDVRGSFENR